MIAFTKVPIHGAIDDRVHGGVAECQPHAEDKHDRGQGFTAAKHRHDKGRGGPADQVHHHDDEQRQQETVLT